MQEIGYLYYFDIMYMFYFSLYNKIPYEIYTKFTPNSFTALKKAFIQGMISLLGRTKGEGKTGKNGQISLNNIHFMPYIHLF